MKKIFFLLLIFSSLNAEEQIVDLGKDLKLKCEMQRVDQGVEWASVQNKLPADLPALLQDAAGDLKAAYRRLIFLMNQSEQSVQNKLAVIYKDSPIKKIEASERASYGDYSMLPDPVLREQSKETMMLLYVSDCLAIELKKQGVDLKELWQ